MRLGKRHLPLVVLLGAAAAVLPALASSAPSAGITAVDIGLYGHAWEADGVSPAQVGVLPGSEVSFSYPSGNSYHYPLFETGPVAPSCTGLPTSTLGGAPGWSGSCTFSQAGVYEFWCGVHGSLMKAFVYVNADGTVPTTTTTTTTSTTPSTSTSTSTTSTSTSTGTTSSTSTSPTSSSATRTQPPLTTGATPPSGSPAGTRSPAGQGVFAEGLSRSALSLATSRHGTTVRGSIAVTQAYGGSRLEVDLLVRGALPARSRRPAQPLAGRLVRTAVSAGKVPFAVSLNARARRALRSHGHLSLTVKVLLTPPGGRPAVATRSVVLHR